MMLPPTHLWDCPDGVNLWPLDRPRHGTIPGQHPVRAPVMVIAAVCRQEPPPLSLMQDHHVVQARATETPDEPLDRGLPPRASWGDAHVSNAHMPHPLPKGGAVDAVPIAAEIPWRLVPREGVGDLVCGPFRRRMRGDMHGYETPPLVSEHHEHQEPCVGDRWHDQAIQGHQILVVVVEQGRPRRGWRLLRRRPRCRHRRFGHVNAHLPQFPDDPGRASRRIRLPHRLDELADLWGHGGATGGLCGLMRRHWSRTRCCYQAITVRGWTHARTSDQPGQSRDRHAQSTRSVDRRRRR
jgi:hypothetical protein